MPRDLQERGGADVIRAGVIGVGKLGRYHAQKYAAIDGVELAGVYDLDRERADQVAREFGTRSYPSLGRLLRDVDLVSIAVPTVDHYEVAKRCLRAGKHVLIEKPLTETVTQARKLINLAREKGLVLQVGHVERFNPALKRVATYVRNPGFIEAERISPFPERGTDVDVILDLMIHDLDLILHFVKSPVKRVHAVGVPVLSEKVDIANARILFESGCVANVTASRASMKVSRKIRIFQEDGYFSIDFVEKNIKVVRMSIDPTSGKKSLSGELLKTEEGDPLLDEIKSFIESVRSGKEPEVTGLDGLRALEVAFQVRKKI
ncbi:MAG: gfo/Idh/MocA family oxidoreductase [Deltaproteobacteria bacterium]|nr:MAG: gfo/Idh/MocA family oxidoreductase [Deltaproteobacteria bacterium]